MRFGRWEFIVRSAALAALAVLSACQDDHSRTSATQPPDASGGTAGGGGADGTPGPAGAGTSAQAGSHAGPTRAYRLATTGVQAVPGANPFYQITAGDVATDADVIAIHEEYYGIPWAEFESNLPPPALWVAKMDELGALGEKHNKEVYLALLLGREWLADRAVVKDGKLDRTAKWSARCYDFARAPDGALKQAAYARYVGWMVERFQPRWVNVAIEMNSFLTSCPDAWPGYVEAERAAYDAAKAAKPDVVAFASFQIDTLMGFSNCTPPKTQKECYEANYAQLSRVKRDRFGVSTYPHLLDPYRKVSSIPPDWFTRVADRGGERVIIAEAGWNSDSARAVLGSTCTRVFDSDEPEARAYLDLLLTSAEAHSMDLVTWWSGRDLIERQAMTECPCSFDAGWCAAIQSFRSAAGSDPTAQFFSEAQFKIWGTMGLRRYDGTPKSLLMERWQRARRVPLQR